MPLTAACKLAIFGPVATTGASGRRAINLDQALTMRNLLVILAVAFLPVAAHAQIMKCVGSGGRVEFAASCPPGTKAESTGVRNNPGAASAAPQKSLSERDADFRKRQVEQQEGSKKSAEKAQDTAERKQNCESAQAYMRGIESGGRLAKMDPATGERVFLEDSERAAEAARAQRAIDTNCK